MVRILIDFETTGLNVKTDEIIEAACMVYTGLESAQPDAQVFQKLCKPTAPISTQIERLTGITNEAVRDEGNEKQLLHALIEWVSAQRAHASDAVLFIAHNGNRFDSVIFHYALTRANIELPFTAYWYDTYRSAKHHWTLPRYTLAHCYQYVHGCDIEGAHRALSDVKALASVYRLLDVYDQSESDPL